MSILPLLMLVGVASSKVIISHNNDDLLQPIATPSQARRICAELCLSGLGGEPCGENCLDISPQTIPVQSVISSATDKRNYTRRDACTVLCPNRLGYPLCNCNDQNVNPQFKVDYVQICGFFCLKYSHQIYGCQSCEVYAKAQTQHGGAETDFFGFRKAPKLETQQMDWESWCKEQCRSGTGGSACNCDILPFAAGVNNAV